MYKSSAQIQPVCPLEKVIECDQDYILGYRNKVEFTIGRKFVGFGKEGPICVGFNQGNLAKGILYVDIPDNIKVISAESIQVAKELERIVVQSGIEPFDRVN